MALVTRRDVGSPPTGLRAVMHGELYGRTPRSMRQLQRQMPGVWAKLESMQQGMASLLLELEQALVAHKPRAAHALLLLLARRVCEGSTQEVEMNREALVMLGGPRILLQLLVATFQIQGDEHKELPRLVWAMRNQSLVLLRELCFTLPFFSESLACHKSLIADLFHLMAKPDTFDNAVGVAEEILASSSETYPLSKVPRLGALMLSLDAAQLSTLCRLLALMLYHPQGEGEYPLHLDPNPPSTSYGSSLANSEAEPPRPGAGGAADEAMADLNQKVLLELPGALQRLLALLKVHALLMTNPAPTTLANIAQHGFSSLQRQAEFEQLGVRPSLHPLESDAEASWMLEGLASLSEDSLLRRATPSSSGLDASDLPPHLKPSVVANHQVEVLFVLCAVLGGKHKARAQDELARLGLIDALTLMFHHLEWGLPAPSAEEDHHGMHGPGCMCNPESTLKIQYLRLIHNFCDRDARNERNKSLLLSPEEHAAMSTLSLDYPYTTLMPSPTSVPQGLLSKILTVLKNEDMNSMYRFWLAACVEAFLRGSNPANQLFVARSGLMPHLLSEILDHGFKSAASLQINFDLLGELVKFNRGLLNQLDLLLEGPASDAFFELIVTNLVDSNVFLRSLMLSLQRLLHEDQQSSGEFGKQSLLQGTCRSHLKLATFMECNWRRILWRLMGAVERGEMGQENICVVNTALIFLLFAHREHCLSQTLHALQIHQQAHHPMHCNRQVLSNFRELLEFWQRYYCHRGHDFVSLEFSSGIPYREWLDMVQMLCGPDDSPMSLSYLQVPTAELSYSPYVSREPHSSSSGLLVDNQALEDVDTPTDIVMT